MTMKRYINLLLAFCVSALTLQSCFQDMDHPAFDYPDSSAPKVFSPMKLFLPFENDMRDKGNYTFLMSAGGDITYTDGINGQAYQGTKDTCGDSLANYFIRVADVRVRLLRSCKNVVSVT